MRVVRERERRLEGYLQGVLVAGNPAQKRRVCPVPCPHQKAGGSCGKHQRHRKALQPVGLRLLCVLLRRIAHPRIFFGGLHRSLFKYPCLYGVVGIGKRKIVWYLVKGQHLLP